MPAAPPPTSCPLMHLPPQDAMKNSQPDPCHYQTIAGLGNITSPVAGGPTGKPGQPGPPVYVSAPHFCQADPRLAQGVEGLACDPQQHVTYVDIEPTTGRCTLLGRSCCAAAAGG
jgi:hypothetical protein